MSEDTGLTVAGAGAGLVNAEFTTLQIAALFFVLAALASVIFWVSRNKTIGNTSYGIACLAVAVLTASVILRYINVGHIPYVQLYETFFFMAWCAGIIAIISDPLSKSRLPTTIANILVGFILIYIIQWPAISKEGVHLVPALQSPWLDVHIATAFLSYAGFAISAGASIVYLVKGNEKVDELSYKLVTFSFPLLGLAIFLGAVWANVAWGKYWQWDPKETASLVTWLVYAGYLHARIAFGWKGTKASIFNIIGFACVIFTWVGLSILSKYIEIQSLHVYS
ncbi:MAG: cytochrome c biogenesis protein CcsA [bacterium]|nr:cytochrome c biogenesis protein CcsA [bacterium]